MDRAGATCWSFGFPQRWSSKRYLPILWHRPAVWGQFYHSLLPNSNGMVERQDAKVEGRERKPAPRYVSHLFFQTWRLGVHFHSIVTTVTDFAGRVRVIRSPSTLTALNSDGFTESGW